jgi:hypothetical protein
MSAPHPLLNDRVYLGCFYSRLLQEPLNGPTYLIVREDSENEISIREAPLVDVYPNPNTKWPTYVFEYGRVLKGGEDVWPRRIGRDCDYSLYQ